MWEYINIHAEIYIYIYIYMIYIYIYVYIYIYIYKNYTVASDGNETNKPNKGKIYKSNKYIEVCMKIYENTYIQT